MPSSILSRTAGMPIAFLLVLFFLSSTVAAQDEKDERLARFLKRFPNSDLNQDGKLTLDEVREFNRTRRDQPRRPSARGGKPQPAAADFAYGDHKRQRFDLWAVPNASQPTPLVIYIHGGGFRGGDKKSVNGKVIADLREKGIATASLNYRLSESGPYPIMMHDAARALQTIRHHAAKWNIDPRRIGCFGGSAGAGISMWLAFHDDMADPENDDPIARQSTRIVAAGASGGQSTYDMRTFRQWFGVPDLAPHAALVPFYGINSDADWDSERVKKLMQDASAIHHLSQDDDAPIFMGYSRGDVPVTKDTDPSVWVHHCRLGFKLKEAMEKLGKECHVITPDVPRNERKYQDMPSFFAAKLLGGTPAQP